MTAAHEVLVVGGGIGGLALAVALQAAGQTVSVCERAPALREIGAGILLTPNASWVLHRLGLLEAARRAGKVVKHWRILSPRGQTLQTFRVGGSNAPSLSLTRAALQELLRQQLSPGTLQLNREAANVEPGSAIRFANGEVRRADLIIGADGGRSVLRSGIRGARPARTQPYVGWRALVEGGPAGWEDGTVSESWAEGCRFGIAPVGGGRCYWYATENLPPGEEIPMAARKARLVRRFQRWHDPIPALIDATPESDLLFTAIADHPPLASWHDGRVVLLGDAAHLMTPNLGQGAAMALEDAWVLAGCLATERTLEQAIAQYEQRRRPRTRRVAWLSRQVGRMIQLEHPLLWRARNLALRLTADWLGTASLAPVFNFRV